VSAGAVPPQRLGVEGRDRGLERGTRRVEVTASGVEAAACPREPRELSVVLLLVGALLVVDEELVGLVEVALEDERVRVDVAPGPPAGLGDGGVLLRAQGSEGPDDCAVVGAHLGHGRAGQAAGNRHDLVVVGAAVGVAQDALCPLLVAPQAVDLSGGPGEQRRDDDDAGPLGPPQALRHGS
jgi:hypothetical protein